jgi:hypothetical protein
MARCAGRVAQRLYRCGHPVAPREEAGMPAEQRGTVYGTRKGYGIRWFDEHDFDGSQQILVRCRPIRRIQDVCDQRFCLSWHQPLRVRRENWDRLREYRTPFKKTG